MRALLSAPLIFVLTTAGCSTSVEVKDFKPAQGPQGIQMEISLNGDVIDGNKIAGELLEVRGDGVLLNVADYPDSGGVENTVVLIPFWMMDRATLEQMGSARVESQGEEANKIYLERLRLVSRFPQGLSDELLADLLSEQGQKEVQVPHRKD
jgi:hypothetical protein